MENLAEVQDIEGTVSAELFMACETDNMDIVPETGAFGHAVYLYSVAEGQKIFTSTVKLFQQMHQLRQRT
ncbi:hypothetical protein [Pseudoalteromonas sp. GB56]